jgi:hypothetical protein
MLTVGFKKHQSAAKPMWEGVLRDESGNAVWCCGHRHERRDSNTWLSSRHTGTARRCACEELARRNSEPQT